MNIKSLMTGLLALFLTAGCASEANSPIDPIARNKGAGEKQEKVSIETPALKYEGLDPFGSSCQAFVASSDEHGLLIKIDYNLHGESILDSEAAFYRYDLRNNRYYDSSSTEPQARPALLSAKLTDADIDFDPNEMVEYEQQGLLEQSVRLDFAEMNIVQFENALITVTNDPSKFNDKSNELNQLNRAVVKISHNGHIDSVACADFVITGVETVTFDLDEEHDHDHP